MKKEYNNIEFIRFVFSVLIVYNHILHPNIIEFVGEDSFYQVLRVNSGDAQYIVEFFFLLAGVFLYKTIKNIENISWKDFVTKKVIRLWPVLAFCIVVNVIFGLGKINFFDGFVNLFFLQCSGLSLNYKGINWYVSAYFFAIVFIFTLFKALDKKRASLVLGILVYFGYCININYLSGGLGRETIAYFCSLGVLRAIAGIGLGYFLGKLIDEREIKNGNKNISKIAVIGYSLLELILTGVIFYYLIFETMSYRNKMIFVIWFALWILLITSKRGIFFRILDNPKLGYLGRYSYAIYIMQQTGLDILARTFWKKGGALLANPISGLTISLSVCVIIGIVTYYLVELPATKYLSKRLEFNRVKTD